MIPSKEPDLEEAKKSLGINLISQIVEKAAEAAAPKVKAAIMQIISFYKYLPESWKKKAFWIFNKLWNKEKILISTNTEKPKKLYEVSFSDSELKNLFEMLPTNDQAIMIQGKSMLELIDMGLHGDSDEIKQNVEGRYGQRGLNIVNMLTTKDIFYLIKELGEEKNKEKGQELFNEWAHDYGLIAALISPSLLNTLDVVKKRILDISKKSKKGYCLVNLSGNTEDCTNLLNIVYKMKEDRILNFKNVEQEIFDSGFCKSIKIKIIFK